MRKNFINYKRTPTGTALEFLAPVAVMLFLCLLRSIVPPTSLDNFDIYQLKKPFFPTAVLDAQSNNWTQTNFDATKIGLDLTGFMIHANYSSVAKIDNQTTAAYSALLDPLSPFYFFPSNCYGKKLQYFSPIIAQIVTGSQIEDDVHQQLTLLFQKQREFRSYLNELAESIKVPVNTTTAAVNSNQMLIAKLLEGGTTE